MRQADKIFSRLSLTCEIWVHLLACHNIKILILCLMYHWCSFVCASFSFAIFQAKPIFITILLIHYLHNAAGIILCMHPANDIALAHTLNDPWYRITAECSYLWQCWILVVQDVWSFNINISYWYGYIHFKDKIVLTVSCHHNNFAYTGKVLVTCLIKIAYTGKVLVTCLIWSDPYEPVSL